MDQLSFVALPASQVVAGLNVTVAYTPVLGPASWPCLTGIDRDGLRERRRVWRGPLYAGALALAPSRAT